MKDKEKSLCYLHYWSDLSTMQWMNADSHDIIMMINSSSSSSNHHHYALGDLGLMA
jgi:hypothetical protein